MAKQKKKRTKKYSGSDAAISRPIVTRVSAVNRSKMGQWYFDRRRILKPVLIGVGILIAVVILIIGIVSIFSGR